MCHAPEDLWNVFADLRESAWALHQSMYCLCDWSAVLWSSSSFWWLFSYENGVVLYDVLLTLAIVNQALWNRGKFSFVCPQHGPLPFHVRDRRLFYLDLLCVLCALELMSPSRHVWTTWSRWCALSFWRCKLICKFSSYWWSYHLVSALKGCIARWWWKAIFLSRYPQQHMYLQDR